MKTLGSRIAHYRKLAGLSQARLADACGWASQSRVGNYERDLREPSLHDLALIAKALRISQERLLLSSPPENEQPPEGLPHGEARADAAEQVRSMLARIGDRLPKDAHDSILAAVDISRGGNNVITADFSRPGPVGDEIRIARYDVQGAMGGGKQVHDYPEMLRDVTVSQKHLRELGVTYKDPSHLKIISGNGQSMAPTIQHMDPMISDVSIREYTGDGIYAFTWQGHFFIKSLQIADEDHFLMVSADEKLYPPKKIRVDDTYIQARILLVWNAKRV